MLITILTVELLTKTGILWHLKNLFMIHDAKYRQTWQVYIPVGCVPPAFCPYLPACTAWGGSAPGGSAWGGVFSWGVCSRGGLLRGCPIMHWGKHSRRPPPPRTEWQTAVKHSLRKKLRLRAVMIYNETCRQNFPVQAIQWDGGLILSNWQYCASVGIRNWT